MIRLEQIIYGGMVLGKKQKPQEDNTVKSYLNLLCFGFQTNVEVSEEVYTKFKKDDVVLTAYVPKMAVKKIEDKVFKGFSPEFVGIKKGTLKDITSIPKIKLSVLAKERKEFDKKDSDEKSIWLNATVSGAMSGQLTIKEDVYCDLEAMSNYECSVIPRFKNGMNLFEILTWEKVSVIENEFEK